MAQRSRMASQAGSFDVLPPATPLELPLRSCLLKLITIIGTCSAYGVWIIVTSFKFLNSNPVRGSGACLLKLVKRQPAILVLVQGEVFLSSPSGRGSYKVGWESFRWDRWVPMTLEGPQGTLIILVTNVWPQKCCLGKEPPCRPRLIHPTSALK